MQSAPAYAGTWDSLVPKLSQPMQVNLDVYYQSSNSFNISLDTLALLGFDQMTPVQAAAIPLFMTNKDVVAEASEKCKLIFMIATH
jgi:hypothetical protein